jgi:protein tyrosine phosphatase
MNYEQKYFKYRTKYIDLKSQLAGNYYLSKIMPQILNQTLQITSNSNILLLDNVYNEVFDYLKTTKLIIPIVKKLTYNNLLSLEKTNAFGPTDSNSWIHPQILIGSIPNNCVGIKAIVDKGNISAFLSLRENNELYQYCKLEKTDDSINSKYKKLVFLRFGINDFNIPTNISDTMATIDNIINYINQDSKNKLMIHCRGGHGRTGIITCCVLALLLLETKLYKIQMDKIKTTSFNDANIQILELVKILFKIVQAYTMVNLRAYRKTDWKCIKKIDLVLIPETHIQDNFIKDVIKAYIIKYIKYGFLI